MCALLEISPLCITSHARISWFEDSAITIYAIVAVGEDAQNDKDESAGLGLLSV